MTTFFFRNTNNSVRKRRTQCWLLLLVLYFTVAWSWTTNQHQQRSPSKQKLNNNIIVQNTGRSSLLFSEHQTSDLIISDSELIESIIQAKTTRDVDRTLRKAFSTAKRNNNNTTTTSSTTTTSLQQHVNDLFPQHEITKISVNGNDGLEINDSKHNNKLPLSELSFNVTSNVLRRMAHVSVIEGRENMHKDDDSNSNDDDSILRQDMLTNLLENVGIKLIMAKRSQHNQTRMTTTTRRQQIEVFSLSDILQSLVMLSPTKSSQEKMRPMATIVVDLLNEKDVAELYRLGPIRLVQCLNGMAKLHIVNPKLQHKIYQRLLKPDAMSKLPAPFLVHGLSSLSTFQKIKVQQQNDDQEQDDVNTIDDDDDDDVKMLSRALMRRLRKKNVSQEANIDDLYRAVVATSDLLDLGAMSNMEDEGAMVGFTCLRIILDRQMEQEEKDGGFLLTTSQVVGLISSWASLTNPNREDTVIEQLLQLCGDEKILGGCNLKQLEVIFKSVQKLDMTKHEELTERVGQQLSKLVHESALKGFIDIHPNIVNNLIRWPVFSHRRNAEVMKPYVDAISLLITNDDHAFLERCSVGQVANFMWFLSSANAFDEKVMKSIGSYLLEDNVVDSCSPNMASRILATFTSLIEMDAGPPSESLVLIKQNLFHNYGGHLLSSSLTPPETSAALYAYAKANYIHDMGVFDHLVSILTLSRKTCTSRQLSQSLWSCGKMIVWEQEDLKQDPKSTSSHVGPPYLINAKILAGELSRRVDELSPADIAQVIWALGRLEIDENLLLSSFTNRATDFSSSLSVVEISNILWGIAKLHHKDTELISVLADRLNSPDLHTSPKEASSVLFSLGKLEWRDAALFRRLSGSMMEQIEETNAQSIANTLWAFRAVRLRPPQKLLDTWAAEKLGLSSINLSDL